jgi:hypothetical protein
MPMPTIERVDTSTLRAKIARGEAVSGQAIAAALRESLSLIVMTKLEELDAFADTGRYRAGWQIAANESTLAAVGVDALKPSKFAEERLRVLDDAVEFWQGKVDEWEVIAQRWEAKNQTPEAAGIDPPLDWPGYAKAIKIRDAAVKRRDEYAAGDFTAVFFYGRSKSRGLSSVSRFSDKFYGGAGSIVIDRESAYFQMRNLEPHASIVEKRQRWAFRVAGDAMRQGARRLKGPAARELAKASGLGARGRVA